MGTTTPNHKDVACYYFVLFDMNNTGLWALPRMEVRRQQLRVHRKHLNQRVCLSMVVPLLGLFRLRQELCLQRATRNPGQEPCALVTNLRALTGAATGTQLRILGMLTCLDGSLYLEDTHTVVKLDMSSAAACGGYYSEGMVIIAQGSINDTGAFAVCVLSHPPPESRDIALRTVKGGCTDAIHNSGDGSSHGAVAHDAPWILLSNCHLNSPVYFCVAHEI